MMVYDVQERVSRERERGRARGRKTKAASLPVRMSHRQTEAVGKEQGCGEYEGWP